jgi:anti-sigma28 factor (negative regulator of flagellin synthesis)
MKIGEKTGVERSALIDPLRADGARPLGPGANSGADEIQVSDVARALARLLGRVDDTSPDPARAAQVEILRNAVATGRYQPDLRDVARKLLAEVAAERLP